MNEKEMQDIIDEQAERIETLEEALNEIHNLLGNLDEDLIEQVQKQLNVL